MNDYLIKKRLTELSQKGSLTAESNLILFKEYQSDKQKGIKPEDSNARTLLILGNKSLIYYVLKKDFGLVADVDNLDEVGVAKIGLVKAIDTYNPESNILFSTYACVVIVNQIRMYYRNLNSSKNIPQTKKLLFEDHIGEDKSGNPVRVLDFMSEEDDFIKEFENVNQLEGVVKNFKYLTKTEILCLVYYFGLFERKKLTQKQIGEKLSLSRNNICKHINRGVLKLKCLSVDPKELTEEESVLRYKLLKRGVDKDIGNLF